MLKVVKFFKTQNFIIGILAFLILVVWIVIVAMFMNIAIPKGKIAICLDDVGHSLEVQHEFENLGIPLTFAIMPNSVYVKEARKSAIEAGFPIIIHQPMEAYGDEENENAILTSMNDEMIRKMLGESIQIIPEAIGMNNHMGSKATADKRFMKIVMSVLSEHNMFFLNSATNKTRLPRLLSREYGVSYVRNRFFIDGIRDKALIRTNLRIASMAAKNDGAIVAIAHCRKETAEAFKLVVPELLKEGFEFVYLTEMLEK